MSRLIGLYPAPWRARYEAELRAILDERPATFADRLDLVRGALDARLHPELVEPGVPAVDMPPESRAPGSAAVAGGLVWVTMAVVVVLETYHRRSDLSALLWSSLFFMTIGLIGPVPAARGRQMRRGVIAAGVLMVLGLVIPWGFKAVPLFALVVLIGAGLLAVAGLRAGLSATARIAVVAIVWVVPWTIAALGSMGLLDFGPGTDWIQGAVAAPYGVAWIVLGLLMVRRGRTAGADDGLAPAATDGVPA
jgi:hypothetical protein